MKVLFSTENATYISHHMYRKKYIDLSINRNTFLLILKIDLFPKKNLAI